MREPLGEIERKGSESLGIDLDARMGTSLGRELGFDPLALLNQELLLKHRVRFASG